MWGPADWMHVPAHVHDGAVELLSQIGQRTVWLPAQPGRVLVCVAKSLSDHPLSPETHGVSVDLLPGEVALLVFSTPRPSLSGRFDEPVWCDPVMVRRLSPS